MINKRRKKAPPIPREEEQRLISEAAHRIRKLPPASEIAEIFTCSAAKDMVATGPKPAGATALTEAEIQYRIKKATS